jgi:hypothetical protein
VVVLALNAFLAMLLVVAGLLFRRSAPDRSAGDAA